MFITTNTSNGVEIRISNEEIDGRIIYKGHKLGVPDELLPRIIHYTFERYNNSYHFLDYKKWNDIYHLEKINFKMTQCWFNDNNNSRALLSSYNTLLDAMTEIVGKFRNIYIVEI